MGEFEPGQSVPKSGVYRVYHDPHRLMHEATLLAGELFPCCRQCDYQVRFQLHRALRDSEVYPFHSGEILREYSGPLKKPRKMGRRRMQFQRLNPAPQE